jgi:hypothetical protein
MHAVLVLHSLCQFVRGVLELLVGEKSRDQDVAGLLGDRSSSSSPMQTSCRARAPTLISSNVAARRKFAGDVEIEVGHAIDMRQILVGDVTDRDVAHVYLLPRNEMQ